MLMSWANLDQTRNVAAPDHTKRLLHDLYTAFEDGTCAKEHIHWGRRSKVDI